MSELYSIFSGIGYEMALGLASKGCRVIIADKVDVESIVNNIITITNNRNIVGKKLDLISLQSVRSLAEDLLDTEPRLDVLINNAGIAGDVKITYTQDDLEKCMQVNYFGHFLLTHLLIDLLKKSSPSRIIFTSSVIAYLSSLSLEKFTTKGYPSEESVIHLHLGSDYGASKLCMAIAAKMFGEKLIGTGVTANAFHPGAVGSWFYFTDLDISWRDFIRVFGGVLFLIGIGKSTEAGAQTGLYLANAKEVKDITGKMFMEGKIAPPPFQIKHRKFCDGIWENSIVLTKMAPHEVKC